jgi:hypothetical protein
MWLYIQLPYNHDGPNNSFGVDQNFKMAISHGHSLHCSFMWNSLSSLREALKRMNSIKFGRDVTCQIMHKWCNLVTYGSKGIKWNFRQFLMNITQVNYSESCEPLSDFFHLHYNYKCMCFNLYIKWCNHGKIGCFLLQKNILILNYFKNR